MNGKSMQRLGKLIEKRRITLSLTQKDIAQKLATSESYVSKLERGDYLQSISVDMAIKLARILEMEFSEFAKTIGLGH